MSSKSPSPSKKKKAEIEVTAEVSVEKTLGEDAPNSAKKARKEKLENAEGIRRDIITPLPITDQNKHFKIMSWNVAGLRAIMKKSPEILNSLVLKHTPDVLCLQETKLQREHVKEHVHILKDLGYSSTWLCSDVKKGYSGVVIFTKDDSCGALANVESIPIEKPKASKQQSISSFFGSGKAANNSSGKSAESVAAKVTVQESAAPSITSFDKKVSIVDVTYDTEVAKGEGRTITIEFDKFFFVGCYVPNSGEGLVRLDERVNSWEPMMRNYLKSLEKKKPVVYGGDLNVAHLDLDIYNYQAKHVSKVPGVTPQERSAFGDMLKEGFVDAFRFFYPEAYGHYTYWSLRTFARVPNKGLRIDYFICSDSLAPEVVGDVPTSSAENGVAIRKNVKHETKLGTKLYDSYCIHDDTGHEHSDHCPIVLVLKL
jgi:exodeoxyribonuclease III